MSKFLVLDNNLQADLSNLSNNGYGVITNVVSGEIIDENTGKIKINLLPRLTISNIFIANTLIDRNSLITSVPLVTGDTVKVLTDNSVYIYDGFQFIQIYSNVELDSLLNVDISSIQNNEYLYWNSTLNKWKNKKINLNDIENINLDGISDKNLLIYDDNDSKFKPYVNILDNITNVVITNALSTDYLKFNGLQWVNSNISLDNIVDIAIQDPMNGQALIFDQITSKFVNSPIFNSPMISQGDMIYYDNFISQRLPIINNKFLKSIANTPTWTDISYNDISNFLITAPLNLQALIYNSTTNKFQNQNIYQNPLTINGDLAYYNNGTQRLAIGSSNQILRVSEEGLPLWTTVYNIDSIIKTNLSNPVSTNFLKFNGIDTWVNSNILMSNIFDTNITSVLNNQVLSYNSTQQKWINQTPTSGGMADPMLNTGDMIYRTGVSGTNDRLAIGGAGQVLKVSSSGIPSWSTNFIQNFKQTATSLIMTSNVPPGTDPSSSIVLCTNAIDMSNVQSSVIIGNSIRPGSASGEIMIGLNCGNPSIGASSANVCIGSQCLQNTNASAQFNIAIGSNALRNCQTSNCIGIGRNIMFSTSTTAIGSVFIGDHSLANGTISSSVVCIGRDAGTNNIATQATILGSFAAVANPVGSNSICIGAFSNASANSGICINATGAVLNASQSGFYCKPVRSLTQTIGTMMYDSTTGEISYNASVSSQIVKKNIQYIDPCNHLINDFKLLKPCKFNYINESDDVNKSTGFIAEDLMELQSFQDCIKIVESVTIGGETYTNLNGIDYQKMNMKLYSVIQKLILNMELMKSNISQLNNRLSVLEN